MRRIVFLLLGILELAAAILLVALSRQLPDTDDVEEATEQIEQVGTRASRQVGKLRTQLDGVRRRQPHLLSLSRKLEKQMKSVSSTLKKHQFNGNGLARGSEALEKLADGLDGLADVLDPRHLEGLTTGLGSTANYLDGTLAPAAEGGADRLDKVGTALKTDAARLKALLKETPVELTTAKNLATSLGKLDEGLDGLSKKAKTNNLKTIREGVSGLETSLDTAASQIDKLAKYSLPKVKAKGLKIEIEEIPLWPEGKKMADGLRKAAKGCKAAGQELDLIARELPKVQSAVDASRKIVTTTKQALDATANRHEKLEPAFKRLPTNLVKLGEDLPKVTDNLAKALRDTERLKKMAESLRRMERSIDAASERWPGLRAGLMKSSALLRATHKQLTKSLENSDRYEQAVERTVELAKLLAEALPAMIEHLETGLEHQDQALSDLGDSIDRVTDSMPAAGKSAANILRITRWLLSLTALMVSIHAVYLLLSLRLGKDFAGA